MHAQSGKESKTEPGVKSELGGDEQLLTPVVTGKPAHFAVGSVVWAEHPRLGKEYLCLLVRAGKQGQILMDGEGVCEVCS